MCSSCSYVMSSSTGVKCVAHVNKSCHHATRRLFYSHRPVNVCRRFSLHPFEWKRTGQKRALQLHQCVAVSAAATLSAETEQGP